MWFICGVNIKCYVDYFQCKLFCFNIDVCKSVDGGDCDDSNFCIIDYCDSELGKCSYKLVKLSMCLIFNYGNNLISFGMLFEKLIFVNVFGVFVGYVEWLISEVKLGYWLDGQWVGNLYELECIVGYWVFVKFLVGVLWIVVLLLGTVIDFDVVYLLYFGVNSILFVGLMFILVFEVLVDVVELFFIFFIGQGIVIFFKDGKWIGSF